MPASAASSSQSPKKAKPYDAADKVKAPLGIKQRRQEWIQSLPAAWVVERGFTHPEGTTTVAKGQAMKDYKLNQQEISTLPYVPDITKQGHSMRLYAAQQLAALATRKSKALQTPLPEVLTGGLPAFLQHYQHPDPPPLIITDYTCPPQATTADPAIITWEPSKLRGPVNVKEACRLYCVSPEEIRDLSDHSPSIDLGSVARRAVTLHGGFHAHKALAGTKRRRHSPTPANARAILPSPKSH
ncbi:hypothetical protein C8R46DRAFT_446363 [Mycena filopes]|nr:hypothetical protein C8R46DRAFT_446363 [Mycena filopes]